MERDPLHILKQILAKAYTDAYALNKPRSEVLRDLKGAIDEERIGDIVTTYRAELEAVVRARTLGERCGDHLSQAQLALLKDALAQKLP